MTDRPTDIRVDGDNTGVIVGGSATLNVDPAVYREVLREVLADQVSGETQAELKRMAAALQVSEAAVTRFFQTLGEASVAPDEVPGKLQEIAERHNNLLQELATIRSDDPEVQRLKAEARAAIEAGEYEPADRLLVEAHDRQLAAEKEAHERLASLQTQRAETLAERAALASLDFRYLDAAALYAEAAETLPPKATQEQAECWHHAGRAYSDGGDYRAAAAAREEALHLMETFHADDEADLAATLNDLALSYKRLGRYEEAEPVYRRSLAIKEKALGPEHPDVATTLNNLAGLYEQLGRYEEAEPLYRRSLAITEKALGPDHPHVAAALNNLALLYRQLGRYEEAEPLYRRSLAITEKALGPDHPHVAAALNNLAVLFEAQDRFGEARPLYERALAITEAALGKHHPSVANRLVNMSESVVMAGDLTGAAAMLTRAVTIFQTKLGPDHPNTITAQDWFDHANALLAAQQQ